LLFYQSPVHSIRRNKGNSRVLVRVEWEKI
jgi:hypothetical protein